MSKLEIGDLGPHPVKLFVEEYGELLIGCKIGIVGFIVIQEYLKDVEILSIDTDREYIKIKAKRRGPINIGYKYKIKLEKPICMDYIKYNFRKRLKALKMI